MKITKHKDVREITLPLIPKQLQELQKNDTYCSDIAKKLHKDTELQKIFSKESGVLYRLWIEGRCTYKCTLVPQILQDSMVILAHDYNGHNGSRRTYNCLKKQYYWEGSGNKSSGTARSVQNASYRIKVKRKSIRSF